MSPALVFTQNGGVLPRREIPRHAPERFAQALLSALAGGWRVVSYFGMQEEDGVCLFCLLSFKSHASIGVMSTLITGKSFYSLVADAPQLHLFEREIAEQFYLDLEGHPWPKPVRFAPAFGSLPGDTPEPPPPSASWISTAWRVRRCTRWPSARCTPASSNPAISASSASARR